MTILILDAKYEKVYSRLGCCRRLPDTSLFVYGMFDDYQAFIIEPFNQTRIKLPYLMQQARKQLPIIVHSECSYEYINTILDGNFDDYVSKQSGKLEDSVNRFLH